MVESTPKSPNLTTKAQRLKETKFSICLFRITTFVKLCALVSSCLSVFVPLCLSVFVPLCLRVLVPLCL